MKRTLVPLSLAFLLSVCLASAADLKEWKVEGDVSLDSTKVHASSGASIKVAPGAKVIKPLRAENGSGHVSLWVYDDKTAPTDPKAPRVGPSWGVIQKDGKMLIVGNLYAGYISGDSGVTAADGESAFYKKVQWLSIVRKEGWTKWDFIFDPEKGCSILANDKPVRFDWNKTEIVGFTGVAILGDEAKGTKMQTLWVDDVTTELGPPMKIQPVLPPPPPPFLPDKDPEATGQPVKLTPAVAGKHPRLLITADRISQLKAFYESDAAKIYREQLLSVVAQAGVPENRKIDSPATWGNDIGVFKLPNTAMHYLLTKDKTSLEKCVSILKWLNTQPNWTMGGTPDVPFVTALENLKKMPPGGENNSDTTAAFTMVGAGLAFDWLYNELDPEFREQFRQTLWQHARAMYYGGHLGGNPGGGYWRSVPMYNHRWFRDWGMTFAAVAAAEGKPEEQWFLGKLQEELKFMADWLPTDGSTHEGPGYGASSGALGLTFIVSDECLGTHHFDQPFFKNLTSYAIQLNTPGFNQAIYFADCFTKARSVHPFYLKTAAQAKQAADVADGIRHTIALNPNSYDVHNVGWMSLLCDNPKLQGGNYKNLPTAAFFPDLGLAILHESWEDNAVAAMFKCGPPGGYNLNSWAPTVKTTDGKLPYINVAHDHPDANSFTIFGDGDYLAETNRYPLKPGKLSAGNNTILINGMGQMVVGRPEGLDWMQPSNQSMTETGKITAWKDAGSVVVTEGEAAGSYLAYTDNKTKKSRPGLDRFRRTFIWVKGGYILVLDDIRSPQPVEVTWLMQGAKLTPVDETKGIYSLSKNKAQCEFQLLSDTPFQTKMGVSPANDHSKLLNWQQLQVTANAPAMRFVSIYNPWHQKDLKLTFTPAGADKATIAVTGAGINDTWSWEAAKGKFEAASLSGVRKGGFSVDVNAKTATPPLWK